MMQRDQPSRMTKEIEVVQSSQVVVQEMMQLVFHQRVMHKASLVVEG